MEEKQHLVAAGLVVICSACSAAGCGHRAATITADGRPVTALAGPSVMPPDQRQADFRWDNLQVDFQLEGARLVSSATLNQPKLRLFIWPKQAQADGSATAPAAKQQGETLAQVPDQLQAARPMKLDHLGVRDGELLVVDATHKLRPALWINHIEASLEQFATRPHMVHGPTLLTLRGRVQKSGELTAYVSADPFGNSLSFSARMMLEGLKASELYEFLRTRFNVRAPSGILRVFIGLDASEGRLRGVIKGLVEDLEIEPARKGFWPWVKAEAAELPVDFFASASPKNATAFVIPIEGSISNVHTQIWPVIVSSLHNALVTAIGFGLGSEALPDKPDFLNHTYSVTSAGSSASAPAAQGDNHASH